jgi:DegV family protein with EDD domain
VAAESDSLDDAVNAVEARIPKQRILALLDTLKYVEMGGRVGRVQYVVGSMLDMKAIMGVADGNITALDRVRTRGKAIPKLVEHLRRDLPVESLAVMHAQAPEDAEMLSHELRRELPELEIVVGQIGCVLGTHAGPRALGLAYIKR